MKEAKEPQNADGVALSDDGAPNYLTIVRPFRGDGTPASASKSFQFRPGFGWLQTSAYDRHVDVSLLPVAMEGLDALAEVVLMAAEHDAYIVRGALTPEAIADDAASRWQNRRMFPQRTGDRPSLRDVNRSWLMFDVDGWAIPEQFSIHDGDDHEGIIDALIRDVLPPAFHDVRCFWQWSASCGLEDPTIAKCHLWFWLDAPATNDRMRAHAIEWGVDGAPYSAVQPHYVTAPRLTGAHDPLPARFGWRDGLDDVVTLPAAPSRRVYLAASGALSAPGDWTAPLRQMGDGPGKMRFYSPIRGAIWRYAEIVNRGGTRNDDLIFDLVPKAIAAAEVSSTRSTRTLRQYASRQWLSSMIEQALRTTVSRKQAMGSV